MRTPTSGARPIGKFARLAIAVAVALAVVATALCVGTLVPWPLSAPSRHVTIGGVHRILVLHNAIHTDIAVPIDADVLARFAPLVNAGVQADLPGARFLIFGWGGREFYLQTPTWSDLKPYPLLRGVTLDRSVMHVDLSGDIHEGETWVTGFDLDPPGFEGLIDFIDASFARTDGGLMPIDGYGYGELDRFFEANGAFTAVAGCNTWTAQALRRGGLRTGIWDPLPILLEISLALYN